MRDFKIFISSSVYLFILYQKSSSFVFFSIFSFDELHYGKYVSLYMKNLFFFEKHPPLGKQLIAGVAHFAGYDGNYTFNKIGSEYTEVQFV